MDRRIFLALIALALLEPKLTQAHNIFGEDDRVDVSLESLGAWAAIGKLDNECSATLVGKRLVLTAAHCVVDSKTGAARRDLTYFRVKLERGQSDEKALIQRAWVGTFNPEENRTKDWAVLELNKEIQPEKITPMDLKETDFTKAPLPYSISLVGYSKDRDGTLSFSPNLTCSIRTVDKGRLLNDCDCYAGISGSPLVNLDGAGRYFIEALAVSEYRKGATTSVRRDTYSDEYANVAISVKEVIPVLKVLRETVDQNLKVPKIEGAFELTNPGPFATECAPAKEGEPSFNPVALNGSAIVDTEQLQAYLKRYGSKSLSVIHSGDPIWGLKQDECLKTLRTQKNGLICGKGIYYNIFRVETGESVGGNGAGWAFTNLGSCLRAVKFSTPKHVCAANGSLYITAIRLGVGVGEKDFRRNANDNGKGLEECLRWAAKQ